MDLMQAILLAIVEGLTEYLPVSSTGHIIITSWILGIHEQPFVKDYTVIVQFGAILSVLVLYWRRFLSSWSFYRKLFVAFLPAAVVGLAVKKQIDLVLGDVRVVAVALIAGGIVLLLTDRWFKDEEKGLSLESMSYRSAALIGAWQCLAFIPGVSRSAASILGGLYQKLSRQTAAEFSFFLAVPTLTGASTLKLLKAAQDIQPEQISILVIGNVVSFAVGIATIKGFVGYLTRHGFKWFGIYRIIVGVLILVLLAFGHRLEVV